VRDKINLHRAVRWQSATAFANRVIGELLDGSRARGIIHIFHLVACFGQRAFHFRHRTARAAQPVQQITSSGALKAGDVIAIMAMKIKILENIRTVKPFWPNGRQTRNEFSESRSAPVSSAAGESAGG